VCRYAWLLLACVDAHGRFTWIRSEVPGSTGDAAAWNVCGMDDRLRANHDAMPHVTVFDDNNLHTSTIQPYVVADTAFRLSAHCMKCYDRPQGEAQNIYNAKVIRTRRCVISVPDIWCCRGCLG
jgi:hypothetical protein